VFAATSVAFFFDYNFPPFQIKKLLGLIHWSWLVA
jgi:hypothetical protein